MDIILQNSQFVDGKFYIAYGVNKQAQFTIVDESFPGMNTLGNINRVTCIVRQLDATGALVPGKSFLFMLVIGIGNMKVGVIGTDPTLNGEPLTHENMESCTVRLYEDW